MQYQWSLLGGLLLSAVAALPVAAETLVSDSGLTRIYNYQFTHYPGDVIEYTTEINGRRYHGVINVTTVANSLVRGWFSDRDQLGDFGCMGEVSIQFVGNNRYVSVWRVGGTPSHYVKCPQEGTTARLNMSAYP
ncbi:hypothetical protein RYO59_000384 [Thermosynechococcaceae cyanobacterium Okahandja]